MKHYIEQRYNEVQRELEAYTHKIDVLRAELDMLQPKYDAFKESQRAEREQAQKDVLVQDDSGVFVTAEQHAKIKSGEIEIVVRGKKKPKPVEVVEPVDVTNELSNELTNEAETNIS